MGKSSSRVKSKSGCRLLEDLSAPFDFGTPFSFDFCLRRFEDEEGPDAVRLKLSLVGMTGGGL